MRRRYSERRRQRRCSVGSHDRETNFAHKRPSNARGLIVAQFEEADDIVAMRSPLRILYLGWATRLTDPFSQMRRAAARIEELRHVAVLPASCDIEEVTAAGTWRYVKNNARRPVWVVRHQATQRYEERGPTYDRTPPIEITRPRRRKTAPTLRANLLRTLRDQFPAATFSEKDSFDRDAYCLFCHGGTTNDGMPLTADGGRSRASHFRRFP